MASIRFGAGIVDARGSLSGQTFSRNASGAYIRARVAPTNPATPAQTAVRSAFGAISSAWGALSQATRDAYNSAAAGSLGQYVNRLGEVSHYTGQQLFQKLSTVAALFGEDPPDPPPPPPDDGLGIADIDISSALDGSGSWDDFQFTGAIVGELASAGLLIYASAPVSPGKTRPRSAQYRLILADDAWDGGTIDLVSAYEAVYPEASSQANVGLVIWFKAVPARPTTGIVAAEVTASTVITTP